MPEQIPDDRQCRDQQHEKEDAVHRPVQAKSSSSGSLSHSSICAEEIVRFGK
jgi:hypothetical protein